MSTIQPIDPAQHIASLVQKYDQVEVSYSEKMQCVITSYFNPMNLFPGMAYEFGVCTMQLRKDKSVVDVVKRIATALDKINVKHGEEDHRAPHTMSKSNATVITHDKALLCKCSTCIKA